MPADHLASQPFTTVFAVRTVAIVPADEITRDLVLSGVELAEESNCGTYLQTV